MNYDEFVASLIKPGTAVKDELTAETAHLLHMAVGVSGEAGELLDAIKKAAIYGKPLDVANVIEELGDIEFYLSGIRQALGLDRISVIAANLNKLNVRYPTGYSNAAAVARADKGTEP